VESDGDQPVSGSDDEDILLAAHSIHLSEQLINDSVRSTATVTDTAATRLGNGVELVKEQHAWRGSSSL